MSIVHAPTYEWTVEEYERLGAAGIFDAGDRVELLSGTIVVMPPIGYRHAVAVAKLTKFFVLRARERFEVNPGNPFILDRISEPQPDLALVDSALLTQQRHPDVAQVYLIIEVSDSSLRYDREDKMPAYARNGVAEYWILNLEDDTLEVYRSPIDGTYRDTRVLQAAESIAPLAFPDILLRVGEALP